MTVPQFGFSTPAATDKKDTGPAFPFSFNATAPIANPTTAPAASVVRKWFN